MADLRNRLVIRSGDGIEGSFNIPQIELNGVRLLYVESLKFEAKIDEWNKLTVVLYAVDADIDAAVISPEITIENEEEAVAA